MIGHLRKGMLTEKLENGLLKREKECAHHITSLGKTDIYIGRCNRHRGCAKGVQGIVKTYVYVNVRV